MQNPHIAERLAGIQAILRGVYQSGGPLSASSKGTERAHFVDDFLSKVLPPPFRSGSGDITDQAGKRSGQIDVVVEYPFLPSLPVVGSASVRLYLAEGVAAAVEVKSDLSAQWDEVVATARKVAALQRNITPVMTVGAAPDPRIPFFAVGYVGWKELETLKKRLDPAVVQGMLVIDPGLFVSTEQFRAMSATGPWSLWGLVACLHDATGTLKFAATNPLEYAL